MDDLEEQQTRAWVQSWKRRGALLDEIKREELRAITEQDAARIFASMAFESETVWMSPERIASSGMVEQQRIFMLSDEHPARNRRRP